MKIPYKLKGNVATRFVNGQTDRQPTFGVSKFIDYLVSVFKGQMLGLPGTHGFANALYLILMSLLVYGEISRMYPQILPIR